MDRGDAVELDFVGLQAADHVQSKTIFIKRNLLNMTTVRMAR